MEVVRQDFGVSAGGLPGANAHQPEPKHPIGRNLAMLLNVAINSMAHLDREPGHVRAGFTKNHGQRRSKVRAKMSRDSRRMNRGR